MTTNHTSDRLTFEQLQAIIRKKITSQEKGSYSNSLIEDGLEKITRKIGEEAIEVVIAAFINQKKHDNKSREELIGEICDLFYHTLILMAAEDIKLETIFAEFAKRNNKKNE